MKHLKILDLKNRQGETALHLAVSINNPLVVSLLLEVGANPSCGNKIGNTPLHYAVESSRLETCFKLVTDDVINLENDGKLLYFHFSYVVLLIKKLDNI